MNDHEYGDPKEMLRKYNRSKYLLALHKAPSHPSFRFYCETIGADTICDFLLEAHKASNWLANHLDCDDHMRFLRLELITTLKIEDMALAHETRFFFEGEYRAALEELLGMIPGNKTEHIIGVDSDAKYRYNMTIAVSFEENRAE